MHVLFINPRSVLVEVESHFSGGKITFRGEDSSGIEFSLTYSFANYTMTVTDANDNTWFRENILTDCRRLEATENSVKATFRDPDNKRIKIEWKFIDRVD